MTQDAESEDKTHEPSQKKLDDARKRGEIPRSADLNTALAYAGFTLAFLIFGRSTVERVGAGLQGLLAHAEPFSRLLLSSGANTGAVESIGLPILPIFGLPLALVLLFLLARRAITFHGPKLAPKLNRISIVQNAKQKFGRAGLFEFTKAVCKLLAVTTSLSWFLAVELRDIATTARLEGAQISLLLSEMCMRFLFVITAIALVFGGLDVFWQTSEHRRKNRMSHKELKDEHKEAEGDPAMKQQRRVRAQQIAMSNLVAAVPKAEVVIVNPTHFAVALAWDRNSGKPPTCVAKGTDEIAARIRQIASESGVPIHSDPPTARALHASLNIGDVIKPELYAPVAAAIRFSDDMRSRMKSRT